MKTFIISYWSVKEKRIETKIIRAETYSIGYAYAIKNYITCLVNFMEVKKEAEGYLFNTFTIDDNAVITMEEDNNGL